MDYRSETFRKYLDDAASSLPAPGGGSVSAVAGALGAAMGCMVCNLTVGKEQFAAVEPQVKEVLAQCDRGRLKLFDLMQADVEAYSHVSRAYRMPRQTPEEKEARKAAIQEACKVALKPPLQTLRECLAILRLMERLVDIGNPNLISDVGVAAILAESALRGAKLNVEINLKYLEEAKLREETAAEIARLSRQVREHRESVSRKVETRLAG